MFLNIHPINIVLKNVKAIGVEKMGHHHWRLKDATEFCRAEYSIIEYWNESNAFLAKSFAKEANLSLF